MIRRDFLAAGAAAALSGFRSRDPDAELRALLDQLDPANPAASLVRLNQFDPAGLSPAARLDRDTVTWGLACDVKLADLASPPESARGEALFLLKFERQFGAAVTAPMLQRTLERTARALTRRADKLLRKQGLKTGSVGARLRAFARDPRFLYSDDNAGRDRAVADMIRTLDAARTRLPLLVSGLPASAGEATVRWLTAADVAAGRQGFREPASDGRPAAYVVDLREIRRRPDWSLPSVVHHETLPGHLVHQQLQDAAAPHRLRLAYSPSFSEGWAVYAEQVAEEAGLLAADPRATIGCLQWLLFRIGRALVDTGVHLHGWDTAKARDFLVELQGDAMIFAPFDQDIDRIRKAPGSRAAEAMTWLGLAGLRRRHAPRGGARMAALHHAMLKHGAMPFALLAARIADPFPGHSGQDRKTRNQRGRET